MISEAKADARWATAVPRMALALRASAFPHERNVQIQTCRRVPASANHKFR